MEKVTHRLAFVAGLFLAENALAQLAAVTHATVIDGMGAAPRNDVTIVMENGRIRDMGPASTTQPPAGAAVSDVSGKYVVPGIINAHGHVGAGRDPQLRQYALYGITTTTSMSFDDDDIVQFKEGQKRGNLRGARVLTVKYRFMSPPNIPGSEVKTPEAARTKVDEIVAKGADFVKVWIDGQNGRSPKLSPEFCAAVMDQARKRQVASGGFSRSSLEYLRQRVLRHGPSLRTTGTQKGHDRIDYPSEGLRLQVANLGHHQIVAGGEKLAGTRIARGA